MRKLTANISKTNTCCIFINQLREKLGVLFGNTELCDEIEAKLRERLSQVND